MQKSYRLIAATLFLCSLRVVGQSPPTCRASAVPQTPRLGSAAEPLGDVILDCSSPNAVRFEVLVASDSVFGNRDLSPSTNPTWGLTDALLLIDDPQSGLQSVCVPASQGVSCSDSGGFNVYQGVRLQNNIIAFQAVAFPAASHRLRIVNLRGDFSQPASQGANLQFLIYSSGKQVQIDNGSVAFPAPFDPATTSVVVPTGGGSADSGFLVPRSKLPYGNPDPLVAFQVRVTENQPNVFRRRNLGASTSDPTFLVNQATPGTVYPTESSFFNASFPEVYGLRLAGLADCGTRIRLEFHGIPKSVLVWVSLQDTGSTSSTPHALLTFGDSNGAGVFSRVAPQFGAYSQLPQDDGSAVATWEIVAADPSKIESLTFSVALSAADGSPGLGAVTMTASLAPGSAAPVHYPAFTPSPVELPAFKIVNAVDAPPVVTVSSASLSGPSVSPGSLATVLGGDLTASTASSSTPVPLLGDLTVTIIDSTGISHNELLYYVTKNQVNLLIDPDVATGLGVIQVARGGTVVASGSIQVDPVAPGLFAAAGTPSGAPAGLVLRVADQASQPSPLAAYDGAQWNSLPVTLGAPGDMVYMILYGTGFRNRSTLEGVKASIGGVSVPVILAAAQDGTPGLDQVSLGPVPALLRGKGNVPLSIQVDGKTSNTLSVQMAQ